MNGFIYGMCILSSMHRITTIARLVGQYRETNNKKALADQIVCEKLEFRYG